MAKGTKVNWVGYWPVYVLLFFFFVCLVAIFVSTLVSVNRVNELQKQVDKQCDSCKAKRIEKREALGNGNSLFGSVSEIDAFLSNPSYNGLNSLMLTNMCNSEACRADVSCFQDLCGALKSVVQQIDSEASNETSSSSSSPSIAGHDWSPKEEADGRRVTDTERRQERSWKSDPSNELVDSEREEEVSDCKLFDRHYLYSFPVSSVATCFSGTNTNALVLKCLPFASELCYGTTDSRIAKLCKIVAGEYSSSSSLS